MLLVLLYSPVSVVCLSMAQKVKIVIASNIKIQELPDQIGQSPIRLIGWGDKVQARLG